VPQTPAQNRQHNNQLEDFIMTLRSKTREEHTQMDLLLDYIYDEEARIRHHAAQGHYRGDLVHRALVKTMEVALGAGISIGSGRMRYRAIAVNHPDIGEMPRSA
jgi:hypothetical protein